MEKTKIVIACDEETTRITLNNPDASKEKLLIMHCCFVNMLLKNLMAGGMTAPEAIEAIGYSDKAAAVMFVKQEGMNPQ